MIRIYSYRNPQVCPYPFAEVENGLPVHPGDLEPRVRALLASGKPWATLSEIVLSMLGWMVRRGDIVLPLRIVHVDKDGTERENMMDVRGDLIRPWPEEGFESPIEAGFHYRYAD